MQTLNIGIFAALTLLQAVQITCFNPVVRNPVTQPFVCPCELDFNPVCGTDGVTYINRCMLDCHSDYAVQSGKSAITEGASCLSCSCQKIYFPVCGMDGQTYANECELLCENHRRTQQKKPYIYLAYKAACQGRPSVDCTTVASPVCGSDNIQYRNLCVLNCASTNAKNRGLYPIAFKNVGACLDACQCPDVNAPVCGSDGVEYKNLCEVACQNRKQTCSLSGPVVPSHTKTCQQCVCAAVYNPVCGGDGKSQPRTYPNPCELECEAKRTNNPFLKVLGYGACPACFCTDQYMPVCGTDCKTYTNECQLRCANYRRAKDDPVLSVFHTGPCQLDNCDCSYCGSDYMPVCGSDRVSYWNQCWLNCNSDCSKKQSGQQIFMASNGSCFP